MREARRPRRALGSPEGAVADRRPFPHRLDVRHDRAERQRRLGPRPLAAVDRDPAPHAVQCEVRMAQRCRGVAGVAAAGADVELRDRIEKDLELSSRHRLVRLRLRKVRPRPGQARPARAVDRPGQPGRIFGRAAEAAHPGVDLQMDRNLAVRARQGVGELPVGNRDAASRSRGRGRLRRQEPAHDEDLLGVDEPAQLRGLLECCHREAGGAAFQRGMGHRHGTVAVGARLDHRVEVRALRQVLEYEVAVGAQRAQVDLRPAKRGGRQRPPWRSTFMTRGISGSRSPASRPESPRRSAMRRPAAAWT